MATLAQKPLGAKAYGHIPHLPASRLGPGDHRCADGQAVICTEQTRDKHDVIFVQEKLDGSCCSVAKIDDKIIALGRAGYPAQTSKYEQHQLFAAWVRQHEPYFDSTLQNGERIVGEWLAQAHGTRYTLTHEPFVAFDLMRGPVRAPFAEVESRLVGCVRPTLLHSGGPCSIAKALEAMGTYGSHGATDPVEGAVWRVERRGVVDFLAKYVRQDKADGCYLPKETGGEPVWNWRPVAA